MRTRFLVDASHCYDIDAQSISDAGGHLVSIGRVEDDNTVTVAIDMTDGDNDSCRRVSKVLGVISAQRSHTGHGHH